LAVWVATTFRDDSVISNDDFPASLSKAKTTINLKILFSIDVCDSRILPNWSCGEAGQKSALLQIRPDPQGQYYLVTFTVWCVFITDHDFGARTLPGGQGLITRIVPLYSGFRRHGGQIRRQGCKCWRDRYFQCRRGVSSITWNRGLSRCFGGR